MAFSKEHLNPIGGQSKRGKAPQIWAYKTEDAIATVDTAGYFDNGSTSNTGMRNVMSIGDLVHVVVVTNIDASNEAVADAGLVVVNANASGVIDTADETALNTGTDTD